MCKIRLFCLLQAQNSIGGQASPADPHLLGNQSQLQLFGRNLRSSRWDFKDHKDTEGKEKGGAEKEQKCMGCANKMAE